MYYPDDVIEKVREANDIVDVIGSVVSLKRAGSNYMGLCPFHSEKSPSFSVSQTKQLYHCFGCGESGNVFTFIRKYENLSFQEAVQRLADRSGIKLPEPNLSEEAKARATERDTLLSLNREAAVYYFRLLRTRKGQRGLEYLTNRGLGPETLKNFGLGYADGATSDLVRHLREKGYSDEMILKSGVASFDERRGLHDSFFNRVMFPIMDSNSRVIGFGGRVMGDGKPKYLNSPETPVFDKSRNLYGLNIARRRASEGYFILCEGYMDVIAMHQAGFTMAVASLGTSFTEGQASLIHRFVKKVLLAYDSDGAGVRAALRNIGILRAAGIVPKVVDLRPHKDPDEFVKAEGAEAFQKRLDEATDAVYFELDRRQDSVDNNDPASRSAFWHDVAKKLASIEDEMELHAYLPGIAERYHIPRTVLEQEIASYRKLGTSFAEAKANTQEPERPDDAGAKAARNRQEQGIRRAQRVLLTAISDDISIYPQIRSYISADDFDEGVYRRAASRYLGLLEAQFGDDLNMAGGSVPAEPVSPAAVVSIFDDEEEASEAARLFETHLDGLAGPREREKAVKDVLLVIKRNSLETLSHSAQATDLLKFVEEKKKLQKIENLQITLSR